MSVLARYVDEEERRGLVRVWVDDELELAATPEEVYALLSNIDDWPTWTPGLSAIHRGAGALVPGRMFFMRLGLLPIPCTLFTMTPARIEWGGGMPGSVVRHRFEIRASRPGRTHVRHVEYATNLLALLAMPAEPFARAHDRGWSNAIRRRFDGRS